MKCENCGRNEANFVYRSSINGRTEEHHLCQACAEKLGYTRRFFDQRPSVMDSFFGNNSFFSSMPSLMGRMLESPFDDFFADMPALNFRGEAKAEQPQQKQEELVSPEEQNGFSNERKLNALRVEMKQAVEQEKFERAAELRDQIRAMETAGQARGENR